MFKMVYLGGQDASGPTSVTRYYSRWQAKGQQRLSAKPTTVRTGLLRRKYSGFLQGLNGRSRWTYPSLILQLVYCQSKLLYTLKRLKTPDLQLLLTDPIVTSLIKHEMITYCCTRNSHVKTSLVGAEALTCLFILKRIHVMSDCMYHRMKFYTVSFVNRNNHN